MNNGEILLRLALAAFCGALLGLERQIHGRPAGLRTHILVATGSALMTLAGMSFTYAAGAAQGTAGLASDPTRIAAGIVTGIGFIGAGAILRTKDMIRGLTTAACIWVAAGAGVASAFGMIVPVLAVTVFSLVVLTVFSLVEEHIPRHRQRDLRLVCGAGPSPSTIAKSAGSILESRGLKAMDLEMDVSADGFVLIFHLHFLARFDLLELLEELRSLEGVTNVAWLEQSTEV
jgi:putative Mg2+ transporter-C (MgtC) family protein